MALNIIRHDPKEVHRDAFSRLRVSEPRTVFDSNFLSIDQSDRWAVKQTGAGTAVTYNSGDAWIELSSTDVTQGAVIRQSRRYMSYQPGKSFIAFVTGTPFVSLTGLNDKNVARFGMFDDNDGYFLEVDGTGAMWFVERSSVSGAPVDTRVAQADWNLDRADGTTQSQFSVDPTKRQILAIEWAWLGVSTVQMHLMDSDRALRPLHRFNHANAADSKPYTNRASLPVRYELENVDATAGDAVSIQICTSVISEGGYNVAGRIFSQSSTIAGRVVSSTTEVPVLSLRCASTRPRVTLNPLLVSFMVTTGSAYMQWNMYRFHAPVAAGVLTGASFVATASAESAAEYDDSATVFTPGASSYELVASGYFTEATATSISEVSSQLLTGSDVDGAVDYVVVTVAKVTGGGAGETVHCALQWQEIE